MDFEVSKCCVIIRLQHLLSAITVRQWISEFLPYIVQNGTATGVTRFLATTLIKALLRMGSSFTAGTRYASAIVMLVNS